MVQQWCGILAAAGVPNAWMRLQRFGNTIYGFRSTNGLDWTLLGQAVVNYTNYLVGFAATAHLTTGTPATLAEFRNYSAVTYSNAAVTITQQPARHPVGRQRHRNIYGGRDGIERAGQ
jgi:hypothetical protein